jgi:hypothetical protein
VVDVSQAFEVNTHRIKTMELIKLKQTNSVEDYKLQFDQLVYHILLYDHSISETMLVSHFLMGLKDDHRHSVEMHLPDTVAQAATLAAVQEHFNDKVKCHPKKHVTIISDNKPNVSSGDIWKVRQLKEYRRANNLCFKYGDKYTPVNTCKAPEATLDLLEHTTTDGGEFLSEDMLDMLETSQLHFLQDDCYMSLHALSGQPQHKVIQLRALVKNQAMVILIDSGSSHTFLNANTAQKLQVSTT